ncbi:MAG: FHA domain-containing protein [Myxococcales bacterium]|nr:FHA domain-containing protein [Myxococcales bacterium]
MAIKGDPKYLSDFVEVLDALGPAAFKVKYRGNFLVGVGLVGRVLDRNGGRRTLATADSEELSAAQALMGRVYPIRKDPSAPPGPMITMGQSVDNDIRIAEYTLSTHHCAFTFDVSRLMIIDLGSMNGTKVNDKRLLGERPVPLPDRSKIAMGRLRFEYLSSMSFFERVFTLLNGSNVPIPRL